MFSHCEQKTRKEVSYLSDLVTDKSIRPDPPKVKAVREFPDPTCRRSSPITKQFQQK